MTECSRVNYGKIFEYLISPSNVVVEPPELGLQYLMIDDVTNKIINLEKLQKCICGLPKSNSLQQLFVC